jgi:hypothetical protein
MISSLSYGMGIRKRSRKAAVIAQAAAKARRMLQ